MKTLTQKEYQEIRTWFHRNARPLEMALWNYFHEDGTREAVAEELAFYQNEDGGFGNAVEPDGWNPESSPYATMTAAITLRKIEFMEHAGTDHPMVQGIYAIWTAGYTAMKKDGFSQSHPMTITLMRHGGHSVKKKTNCRVWELLQACALSFCIMQNRRHLYIKRH